MRRRRRSTSRRIVTTVRRTLTRLALTGIAAFLAVFVAWPGLTMQSWWPGSQWYSTAVLTSSMTPTLPAGTQVLLELVDEDELGTIRLGDVIAFMPREKDTTLVMHRVTGIEGSANGGYTFTTQGDALDQADDPVESQMVRGVQRYHVPYAGHLTTSLNDVLDLDDRQNIIRGGLALVVLYVLVTAARDLRLRRRSRAAAPAETTEIAASPSALPNNEAPLSATPTAKENHDRAAA